MQDPLLVTINKQNMQSFHHQITTIMYSLTKSHPRPSTLKYFDKTGRQVCQDRKLNVLHNKLLEFQL